MNLLSANSLTMHPLRSSIFNSYQIQEEEIFFKVSTATVPCIPKPSILDGSDPQIKTLWVIDVFQHPPGQEPIIGCIIGCSINPFALQHSQSHYQMVSRRPSFLLVDISTSFGEVFYANVSLLRNRKFDLISQSGWITLHATISCELDFL